MSPDASEEILRATYRALCEHGYADLTMQDIADESAKSKAAIHYHYDSKQALLEAFQVWAFGRWLDHIEAAVDQEAPAEDRLEAVLDAALTPPDAEDFRDLQTALLEFRAQAPYVPAYRERLVESDEAFRSIVADILEDGVESGAFDPEIDPDETARFVATALGGHQLRQVSLGQPSAVTRELFQRYIEERIVRDREAPDRAHDRGVPDRASDREAPDQQDREAPDQ